MLLTTQNANVERAQDCAYINIKWKDIHTKTSVKHDNFFFLFNCLILRLKPIELSSKLSKFEKLSNLFLSSL